MWAGVAMAVPSLHPQPPHPSRSRCWEAAHWQTAAADASGQSVSARARQSPQPRCHILWRSADAAPTETSLKCLCTPLEAHAHPHCCAFSSWEPTDQQLVDSGENWQHIIKFGTILCSFPHTHTHTPLVCSRCHSHCIHMKLWYYKISILPFVSRRIRKRRRWLLFLVSRWFNETPLVFSFLSLCFFPASLREVLPQIKRGKPKKRYATLRGDDKARLEFVSSLQNEKKTM